MSLKTGPKPSSRRSLSPALVAAVREYARANEATLRSLSTAAGFPHLSQLSYVLRHPVPANAATLERLTRLQQLVDHQGPVWGEEVA